jgi:hypothetical protein
MAIIQRAPESEGLEIVLVGSFNSAIFHPQWFLRQGLIGEQEAIESDIKVVSPDITDVRFGGLRILCVGDRLTLGTSNVAYSEKLRDLVEAVLGLLPHTPIHACGINPGVHYRVDSVAYWHKIGHALAPKDLVWNDLFPDSGMQNLIIKAPRKGDYPGEINITVQPSTRYKPGVSILVNWHYDVRTDLKQTGGADAIRAFIHSEWDSVCRQARRVAEKIFEKIKPNE